MAGELRWRGVRCLLALACCAPLSHLTVGQLLPLQVTDVSQLFPGLGDLRSAQELKLRELLSPSNPAWERGTVELARDRPVWGRDTIEPVRDRPSPPVLAWERGMDEPARQRPSLSNSAWGSETAEPASRPSGSNQVWVRETTKPARQRPSINSAWGRETREPAQERGTTELPWRKPTSVSAWGRGNAEPAREQLSPSNSAWGKGTAESAWGRGSAESAGAQHDERELHTSRPVWDRRTEEPDRSERPVWWDNAPQQSGGPSANEQTGGASASEQGDEASAPEPSVTEGPDDAELSEFEWRRAVRVAEDMCSRYEALETHRVSAIPLLPAPAPVSVAVSACRPPGVPLVVGGQPVDIETHPHMAALGWRRLRAAGYSWKCGGALVSERYVLTAAHCTYQDRDTAVQSGAPRVVQLGSARLDDASGQVVGVAGVVRHPRYRAPAAYYDIALLRLARAVQFSSRVRPACVGEPPPPGKSVVATGWGRTEYGGDMSPVLRGVALPVWEPAECGRALGTSRKLPRGPDADSQLCAGELRGGKDTCQGDSGGPAVTGAGCSWRVVGVTSLGRACGAPRTPALYARALPAFVASVVWPRGRESGQ